MYPVYTSAVSRQSLAALSMRTLWVLKGAESFNQQTLTKVSLAVDHSDIPDLFCN
jgi:hypothetical protein